jgi:diguanylate cyclase (GGDEF)-like protein
LAERSRFYAEGEVIFREGDANDAVYIVESGSVAIIKAENKQKSVILAKLEPPQMLGELGVLCDMPRNATAQALEDSWLEVIPRNDFTSWISRDPQAALRVMQTLALRLHEADAIIAKQQAAPEQISDADLREINKKLTRHIEEIKKQRLRLEDQAIRDSLTGLYNRRHLDKALDRELTRAKRYGFPISLAMVDLDHFKNVNDTYGHKAGDEVLRALGALLQSTSREEDIPCRYGGEEFLVVLPRMPLVIARQRAEHWREAFSKQKTCYGDCEIASTMSIGLATYPDHAATAEALIDSADRALYRAKSAGRNRLVVAEGDAGSTSPVPRV